jgi:ribosomal protein S18 acetylase RimI-like enzyme
VIVRRAQPADAAGIARVHVDSWRTTYAGIMPAEFLAGLSYGERLWAGWLAAAAEGTRAVCVAEDTAGACAHPDAPRIVGFASGGEPTRETQRQAPEFDGELHTIYLLHSHQRRGLGRSLFRFVAAWLAAQRKQSVFVWVARDNPSRAFYEALGGRLLRESRTELLGQTIDEVGYGWQDVGQLLERLGHTAPA